MNVTMGGKDVMRDQSNVTGDVRWCMICCLAFQGTKIGTEDGFGCLDMLLVDGAVVNVVDGDIHEFTGARVHDDVLYMSCKNGIFVLSLCELFGIASHRQ
jgi:hypothetical protein